MHVSHIASWAAIHERMNTYHATRQISKITLKYLTSFWIFLFLFPSYNHTRSSIRMILCHRLLGFVYILKAKSEHTISSSVTYSSLYYLFICIAICDYLRFGKYTTSSCFVVCLRHSGHLEVENRQGNTLDGVNCGWHGKRQE